MFALLIYFDGLENDPAIVGIFTGHNTTQNYQEAEWPEYPYPLSDVVPVVAFEDGSWQDAWMASLRHMKAIVMNGLPEDMRSYPVA